MSAIHGLNPAPSSAPQPHVVPAPPQKPKQQSWLKPTILAGLILGIAVAAYYFLRTPAESKSGPAVALRTTKVASGAIQRVLRLNGSTSAKNFASIAAPRMRAAEGGRGLVLIYLAKSGSIVKKGDIIARIDAQAMLDHLNDLEAQITQAESDIKKRKAEIALNWENLQQTLRESKAQLDKVKLDAAAAEIRTPIDAEELKLSVEEAESTYKEQLTDLERKKASDAADLRVLEITQEITIHQRDRYKSDVDRFTISAPMGGLVVMQTIFRGTELAQIQQGDQVGPGQPFMKIVDVNGIQVQAAASQVEAEQMRIGQPATISFDGFPDLKLNAKVSNIGAMATAGVSQNYFLRNVPVFLQILDHDNRVIPDLSTSSDVVISQAANSLLIPRSAVESKDGKSFVRVKNGPQFEMREVKLGTTDNVRIAVLEGLREGEEIAIDQPPATPLVASN